MLSIPSIRTVTKLVMARVNSLRPYNKTVPGGSSTEIFVEIENLKREIAYIEETVTQFNLAMSLLDELGAPTTELDEPLPLQGRIRALYIESRTTPIRLIPQHKLKPAPRRDKPRVRR